MKRSLNAGYAGIMILAVCLILFGYMLTGCALSFKNPTTQILTKTATFFAGYEIGKANPELAGEFINYTQADRVDILTFFDSWKRYLAYRLGTDPIHRKLIQDMLNMVEIDLKFQTPDVQEGIIRELFTEFVEGLEAGIDE